MLHSPRSCPAQTVYACTRAVFVFLWGDGAREIANCLGIREFWLGSVLMAANWPAVDRRGCNSTLARAANSILEGEFFPEFTLERGTAAAMGAVVATTGTA